MDGQGIDQGPGARLPEDPLDEADVDGDEPTGVEHQQLHRRQPALEEGHRPEGLDEGDELVVLDVPVRAGRSADSGDGHAEELQVALQVGLLLLRPLRLSRRPQLRFDAVSELAG